MKKRVFLLGIFLVLLFNVTNVYAQTSGKSDYYSKFTSTVDGLPSINKNTKILDVPLAGGLTTFALSMDYFSSTVNTLCILFAFLMIIFNSFKLWSGTMELKKAYIDMVYKCVMCIAVCILYKPVTNGCLKLANQFGTSCCAGYKKIDYVYTEAFYALKKDIDDGLVKILDNIKASIEKNAAEKEWVKNWITTDQLKQLQSYGMTDEEAKEWAKQNGLSLAEHRIETKETWEVNSGAAYTETTDLGFFDENGNPIKETNSWFFGLIKTNGAANLSKAEKQMNKSMKAETKKQISSITKITALMEVLSGEQIDSTGENIVEEEDGKKKANISLTALKKIFYSPYLKDNNGKNTFFLSPSAMIKTVTVMSDAIGIACSSTINDTTGEIEEIKFNPKGEWGFKGIIKMIQSLLYQLGMGLATIIVMCEYTLTILEFYLVRGIATLLIPLLFVDATKSYAQNLMKLLFTYFMKIMVNVLLCFFVLGLYMDMAVLTYKNAELSDTLTFFAYIMIIITGLLLALNASKIAMTVMNGSPAMGIGDIARMGHSMSHAMHSANHMAHAGMHMAGQAGHMAQGAVRGAMNVGSTLDAAGIAGQAAEKDFTSRMQKMQDDGLIGAGDWSQADAKAAGRAAARNTVFGAMKQGIADKAYKAATGQERVRLGADGQRSGFVGFGQEFTLDKNGQTAKGNNFTMAEQNQKQGNKIGQNTAESFAAKVQKRKEDKDRNSPWSDLGF